MAADSDELCEGIGNLSLSQSGDHYRNHGATLSTSNRNVFPEDYVHKLVSATSAAADHARSIGAVTKDINDFEIGSLSNICSLYEQAKKLNEIQSTLANAIKALADSTERSVIDRLTSLGRQAQSTLFETTPIVDLLSHFDGKIRNIIRKILDKATPEEVLWRTAEECYRQAISTSGTLHLDGYFEKEWRSGNERVDRQMWLDFWIKVLDHTPGGPTLFYPRANNKTKILNSPTVPPYLFRTFDKYSHRKISENAIASLVSHAPRKDHQNDILGMDRFDATRLLFKHFKWRTHDRKGEEVNLVSWTSSLPYAIQYALYKRQDHKAYKRLIRDDEIKICVIDTRRFSQGQFVRDIELIDAYYATAEEIGKGEKILHYFNFRLKWKEYHNGEYLSQGAINLAGRSCMVSLEQLENSGLYKLYPEFNSSSPVQLANAVLELRKPWSEKQETTASELEQALTIAWKYFEPFNAIDMACIILAFKNRKLSDNTKPSSQGIPPTWAEKPAEVTQYWKMYEVLKSLERPNMHDENEKKETENNILRKILSHKASTG